MINPRVQAFFRTLDVQLPAWILVAMKERELVFSMAFKDQLSIDGELNVYAVSDLKSGATTVPVEKHWVYDNRVWFRKAQGPYRPGSLFEAFVSYLPEYRDPVVVHLDKPLLCMRLSLDEAPATEMPAPAAGYRLQPQLQF